MEKEIERWMELKEWKGEVTAILRDIFEDVKDIKGEAKHMEECHTKRLRLVESDVTNLKIRIAEITAIVTLIVSVGVNLLFRVI